MFVGHRIMTIADVYTSLATNIIVSSMLILGGSATVTSLTGMNTLAVRVVSPAGFDSYSSLWEGVFPHPAWSCYLRCSWWHASHSSVRLVSTSQTSISLFSDPPFSTHTTVLFIIIFVFIFTVYGSSPKIGSPDRMHDLLAAAAAQSPVSGNARGSYLTIRSKNGLIFGVINVIGNFATVFQDQAVRMEVEI